MKRIIFVLAILLPAGYGLAQQKVVNDPPVSNPQRVEKKGPEYKNQWNNESTDNGTVISGDNSELKGPEYKNKKNYTSGNSRIVVKSTELKGPEYKNRRF